MLQRNLRVLSFMSVAAMSTILVGLVVFKLFGGSLLSVQSGSMVPYIDKGDFVAVTRIPDSQLAVGDVVTYTNPVNKNQTITHRIVALPNADNEYKIVTKGDANEAADMPIAPERIIGRKIFIVPFAGYVFDFAHKPLGLILLIYVPALWILGSEVRRLKDHYKSREIYYPSEAIKRQLQSRGNLNHL